MKIIRYIVFALILISAPVLAIRSASTKTEKVECSVYFVDTELMRLLPHKVSLRAQTSIEERAGLILDEIIKGRDDNKKVRRLIPDIKGGLKVKMDEDTAIVDISSRLINENIKNRDAERLFIYQIVNSLTELDGIYRVRFTVDGRVSKKFMGYLDMREIFTRDEYA